MNGGASSPERGANGAARGRAGSTVLIVDDHPLGRRLIARVLEAAGFDTVEAGSLEEAAGALSRMVAAAIVLDLNLPDGDGLDLARRCRADRSTMRCAIIACSASDRGGERDAAIGAGADAYVVKPIDTRRFAGLVAELVARRRAGDRCDRPLLDPCAPA